MAYELKTMKQIDDGQLVILPKNSVFVLKKR